MKLMFFFFKHKSKELFFLVLILEFFLTSSCSQNAYSVFKLKVENKRYESLCLFTCVEDSNGYSNGCEIPGKSTDGHEWTFIIPDSINKIASEYYIRTRPFDLKKNEAFEIRYCANEVSKKEIRKFPLKNKSTHIKGTYTHTYSEDIRGFAYLLIDTFVMNPRINCDVINLKVKKPCQSDLEIQLSYPYFDKIDQYKFDERLKIIKSYPNSTYLLEALPDLQKSLDKKELNLLFDSFSSRMKHSKDGKNVFDFINVVINPVLIDTLSLVSSNENHLEPIIKDRSKYTFVIFSASWCGPCHRQIPLLKEVFNDCKKGLDMVYISTDRNEEERQWVKILKKEEIPWRSLFARDYKSGLYKQYDIEGIPYSLLIHPNGTIETIDISSTLPE